MWEGTSAKDIHTRLVIVYGDSSPSLATVYNWWNEFKRGRKSIQDEPSSSTPRSVRMPEDLKKLGQLVMADRRLRVSVLVGEMGI